MDAPKEAKVNKIALNNYSTALRKEFKFVEDLNSMACQSATERAWLAIDRFYQNCKKKVAGKKGYPRFQKDNRSVEYKTSGWSLNQVKRRITFTDKKGIGEVRLLGKWDIQTYPVKLIKRVRLLKKADGFYCQFCIDVDVKPESRIADGEIGLDVGLEYFYSDSNGNHVREASRREENPRFLRKAEKAIKHAQRQIYKKEKSKNQRRKARRRYARKHLKVSRQRNEHSKRLGRCVCKANALVAYVRRSRCRRLDLNVKGMVKNHCLAKSINDASWSLFRRWLEYFAAKFNSIVVAVNPRMTSQKCSDCGVIVKKSLSTRTHKCSCGCELQRDVNAAKNILNLVSDTLRDAKASLGHKQSNASGVGITTLVGVSLLEQILTVNEESPDWTNK
jgi:putative transposase